MYLLLTDETNKQRTVTKFFVYGGVFIPTKNIPELSKRVERIRLEAGYLKSDTFKYSSNSRPRHISREKFNDAKSKVIDASLKSDVLLSAYVFLHAIGKRTKEKELVNYGANTILGNFNRFLTKRDTHGICALDRMPYATDKSFQFIETKFRRGLLFDNGRTEKNLDRIHLYSYTSEGASHLASITDILVGSFGYCINVEVNSVVENIFPKLVKLFWAEEVGGNRRVNGYGLQLRPQNIASQYSFQYTDLLTKFKKFSNSKIEREEV
jgi:hypothetical protein